MMCRALFPGGAPNVTTSAYARAGKAIYDLALAANRSGDFFPVWGTCLGLQVYLISLSFSAYHFTHQILGTVAVGWGYSGSTSSPPKCFFLRN